MKLAVASGIVGEGLGYVMLSVQGVLDTPACSCGNPGQPDRIALKRLVAVTAARVE